MDTESTSIYVLVKILSADRKKLKTTALKTPKPCLFDMIIQDLKHPSVVGPNLKKVNSCADKGRV